MPARAFPPSLSITFQFHSLVVSLSDNHAGTYFHILHARHLALKRFLRAILYKNVCTLLKYLSFVILENVLNVIPFLFVHFSFPFSVIPSFITNCGFPFIV